MALPPGRESSGKSKVKGSRYPRPRGLSRVKADPCQYRVARLHS
ncbi:hypothetical protein DVDV_4293 [Desulfovibrio sp. DV]|nr:hypothetical protein DVDV_4293 [Desulfovibrio sp. DV]